MIKNIFLGALLILALGQVSHFGLPWWILVVIAALVGGWLTRSVWQAFFAGFLGGSLLWSIAALIQDNANNSALAEKVGQLFLGVSSTQLILLTGLLGGIMGALGAITGKLGKDMFIKPSNRHYMQERRRR
jgi:hypothetical protein